MARTDLIQFRFGTRAELDSSTAEWLKAEAGYIDDEKVFIIADRDGPTGDQEFLELSRLPDIADQSETDAATVTDKVVVPGYLRMRRDANGAISIGDLSGDARGNNSITIQTARISDSQVASGFNATAVGYASTAVGYANAVGYKATASGNYANAVGYTATASGLYANAIGYAANASGYNTNAIGNYANVSGNYANAIGNYATASGNYANAIGYTATASGLYANAVGYTATASQPGSGAFGCWVKSATANVQELGYWSNSTTRAGAVRVHGTGMVGMTIQDRATPFDDGGATAGSEADNTLLREGIAFRRNGDVILVDVNIGGTVKTLSLGTVA